MKTFTDLYPETPKQSSITLIDKTTRRMVTFNEIETIQLQILVLQGEIPYDRFVQKQAWMNSTTRMMRNVKISPFLANGNRNYEFKDDGRRTVNNVVYRIQASFNAEV